MAGVGEGGGCEPREPRWMEISWRGSCPLFPQDLQVACLRAAISGHRGGSPWNEAIFRQCIWSADHCEMDHGLVEFLDGLIMVLFGLFFLVLEEDELLFPEDTIPA